MYSIAREAVIDQTVQNLVEAAAISQDDATDFAELLEQLDLDGLVILLIESHNIKQAVAVELNRFLREFSLN